MIPQNELRIGNLITFSPSGKAAKVNERYVRITEIRNKSAIADDNGLALELFYESASTKPISLSAEILEKAGFEKSGMLYIHPSTMNFEIWNRAKAEGVTRWYAGRMQKDYFLGISNEIKYLHQLQNLFWCLTGEELPVEL